MPNKMPALEKLLYSTFSTTSTELSVEKSHKNIDLLSLQLWSPTTTVVSNHSRVLSTIYAFMVFHHLPFLFPQYSNSFPVSQSPLSICFYIFIPKRSPSPRNLRPLGLILLHYITFLLQISLHSHPFLPPPFQVSWTLCPAVCSPQDTLFQLCEKTFFLL